MFDCSDPALLPPALRAARRAAGAGELVGFPTDTLYAVGADAFSPEAVAKLLRAKGRSRGCPPPVLVRDSAAARALVAETPEALEPVIQKYWPGPLTVILPARPGLVWDLGDTAGTVAVRVPDNPIALELLAETGPLAASSANLTGQIPSINCLEARQMLEDRVAVYLDEGEVLGKRRLASTILDACELVLAPSDRPPALRLLRLGAASLEDIETLSGFRVLSC